MIFHDNEAKYIFGNWKMHKTSHDVQKYLADFHTQCRLIERQRLVVALFVPFPFIESAIKQTKNNEIMIGAQNTCGEICGSLTGEVSAMMLVSVGTQLCLVAHSERRLLFNETNSDAKLKVRRLLDCGIVPVLCVGENIKQHDNNETNLILCNQIGKALNKVTNNEAQKIIIAYEPLWAIGTGKPATVEAITKVIKVIRHFLAKLITPLIAEKMIILYGGSVNSTNIREIIDINGINGVLVGGASLLVSDMKAICDNSISK